MIPTPPTMLPKRGTLTRIGRAFASVFLLSGCGDDGAGPDRRGPTQIAIQAGQDQLGIAERPLADSVAVRVLDARGRGVAGATIRFVASHGGKASPSTASTDSSGHAITRWTLGPEAGQQQLTAMIASAPGVEATVRAIASTRPGIARSAVVVDSAVLGLVRDSASLTQGQLRFEVRGNAPVIEVDDVLVGAQGGGYLGRVRSVDHRGGELVVGIEPAALTDIIENGRLELNTSVGLGDRAAQQVPERVKWGRTDVRYLASGVSTDAMGFTLDGTELYRDGEFQVSVVGGHIKFTPTVDVGATFNSFSLAEFHTLATGDLEFSGTIQVVSAKEWTRSGERRLATFARPFVAAIGPVPVVGEIRLDLVMTYRLGAKFSQEMQAGFNSRARLHFGGRYAAGAWEGVWEPAGDFTSRPFVAEHEGDAGLRVSVRPVVTLVLYHLVGPSVYADPFARWTVAVNLEQGRWRTAVDVGLDGGVGLQVAAPPFGAKIVDYKKQFTGPAKTVLADSGSLGLDSVRIEPRGLTLKKDSSALLQLRKYWDDFEVGFGGGRARWSSSNAATVTVGRSGKITAVADSGSAYVHVVAPTYIGTQRDSIYVRVGESDTIRWQANVDLAGTASFGQSDGSVDTTQLNCQLARTQYRVTHVSASVMEFTPVLWKSSYGWFLCNGPQQFPPMTLTRTGDRVTWDGGFTEEYLTDAGLVVKTIWTSSFNGRFPAPDRIEGVYAFTREVHHGGQFRSRMSLSGPWVGREVR
jgi:hypothetical protein